MTVIFHTNTGVPLLAGDMLLSVPGPFGRTKLRLPSQPNGITIPSDLIPSYIPVKMRRKIFIVNDHLAAGAAGRVSDIRVFIGELLGEFRDRREFTYSEIQGFLNQYTSNEHGRGILSHIGAIILAQATDWRGSLTVGLPGNRIEASRRFGTVTTIGSGSASIIEQIHRLDDSYKYGMAQPPDGESAFPEFKTLAQNLMLLSNVYWKEFTSPNNIFDAWGGAYDLIYQNSSKVFEYLNDYTIFLRLFDVDQAEKGIQLANVLKYERRPELSFIAMLNNEKLDIFGTKDITASDAPLAVTLNMEEFTMNSRVHISMIGVGKGGRYASPLIQIDGLDPAGQTRQLAFTDFDEEGRLRVFFHAEHDRWLEEQAMSYYQSHASSWTGEVSID